VRARGRKNEVSIYDRTGGKNLIKNDFLENRENIIPVDLRNG
jgi:hypothetical protein